MNVDRRLVVLYLLVLVGLGAALAWGIAHCGC